MARAYEMSHCADLLRRNASPLASLSRNVGLGVQDKGSVQARDRAALMHTADVRRQQQLSVFGIPVGEVEREASALAALTAVSLESGPQSQGCILHGLL